jgi:hypothetical protein
MKEALRSAAEAPNVRWDRGIVGESRRNRISRDLIGLGLLVALRVAFNAARVAADLAPLRVGWFYVVTTLEALGNPDTLLALAATTDALVLIKYLAGDSSLRRGVSFSAAVMVFDVFVVSVAPWVGSGVRWTTPLAQQWPWLLRDIGLELLFDLLVVTVVANLVSTGIARAVPRRRPTEQALPADAPTVD